MKLLASSLTLTATLLAGSIAFAQDEPAKKAATSAAAKEDAPAATPEKAAAPALELKDPIAVVNGESISAADLRKAVGEILSRRGMDESALPKEEALEAYNAILDQLILEKIISAKSADVEVTDKDVDEQLTLIKSQMGSEEAFAEQIKAAGETMDSVKIDIKKGMRQQRWIEKQLASAKAPSAEEVKAFYDANPDKFDAPDRVRASHILLLIPAEADETAIAATTKKMGDIKARVDKGEDFAALAKEFSEDPGSKEKGGDLDFFTKDRMVPEFADTAFKLEVGKVSDPVKTQFGLHLIKVTDKEAAHKVSLEESQPQIQGYLGEQKRRAVLMELFKTLRAGAKVKSELPPAPSAPSPTSAVEPS